MPIHHAIWRVGEQPAPLASGRLASEQQLEDMIVRDPRILSNEWMLIGRQEVTSHGGRVDLLAIAPDASLVLIELKRDRTQPALVALKHADKYQLTADDPERAECFVRVRWLNTVPESKAINEVGLFGNQNTVCQPTTPKWRHTVERLKVAFPQWSA
jgi:hypothetical protein